MWRMTARRLAGRTSCRSSGSVSRIRAQGIGNKGLGFRSVLLLTDHPEVYSRDPDDTVDQSFSGYSFRFPAPGEMTGLTDDDQLGRRLAAEVSPFDLPVPACADDPEVLRFGFEGFASVVKLPLPCYLHRAEAQGAGGEDGRTSETQ